MEAAPVPALASPLGRISISHDAVAHIVGRVAAEAYGVVGMASRKRLLTRDPLRQGVTVGNRVDVEVVDAAAACLERCEPTARELADAVELADVGHTAIRPRGRSER